ncbi:MAG: aldehyde dehydrogenase family protein [Pseudomonadota bacterium]
MAIQGYWQSYINGEWVDGAGGRLAVDNPSTGEHLADVALADAADVEKAMRAARACVESRALTAITPVERGRMVRAMGDWILARKDEIAEVLTLESGKPLFESKIEVDGAARFLEYFGNQADTLEGKSIPLGDDYYDFTTYEPMGTVVHIIPWNFPIDTLARGLAPALVAGNANVIKTPELTPLTIIYIARAAEAAGFPPGAVNLMCGYGHEAGAALAAHPDANLQVFTGSVATGISVATAAAKNVVPCVLELGGKSAAVVYDDADIENLIENVRWALFFHAGQICSAMSRVLVHEKIYDDVIDAVRAKAEQMKIAPGIEDADMGAMTSLGQRDRAASIVEKAVAEGAQLVTGGSAPDNSGAFYKPTLFANVTPEMDIAHTEVFGPVLAAIPFKTDAEALAIANDSQYGLVGGVFTKDLSRAMRTAQSIQAGQIFVNEWFIGGAQVPFGGYKKSGYGREKGRDALLNYVQTKNIGIKI